MHWRFRLVDKLTDLVVLGQLVCLQTKPPMHWRFRHVDKLTDLVVLDSHV